MPNITIFGCFRPNISEVYTQTQIDLPACEIVRYGVLYVVSGVWEFDSKIICK